MLLLILLHFCYNRSSFEEVLTWREADAVLVTPVRHTGTPAICPLIVTLPSEVESEHEDTKEEGCEEGNCDRRQNRGVFPLVEKKTSSNDLLTSEDLSTTPEEEIEEEKDEGEEESEEEKSTTTTAGDEGERRPSFIFQRRKFVLHQLCSTADISGNSRGKNIDNGTSRRGENEEDEGEKEGGDEEGAKEETFGLVEVPVGWPLGR